MTTRYDGLVLKNDKGHYYCENTATDWWFDESLRFACIFETPEDMTDTLIMLNGLKINTHTQHVEFEVIEKVVN